MSSPGPLPHRKPAAVIAFLVLGLAAVFFLPFWVPMSPSISDSYTFGFNNRAALLLFVAFAVAFAYWSGGLGLVARPVDASVAPPMSRRLLYITVGITAAMTVAFWLLFRTAGAINEGFYLMDRLQHLAAGERIYRDFEFIYGPLVLYMPYVLYRVLHLPLLDAYYLAWIFDWVVGMTLLWFTVQWAAASSPRKNGIYLLAFLGFIFSCVALGLNYTPLRFVSAPFFAVCTARLLRSGGSTLRAVLLALAGGAWVLFLSPEQGIAFCLGTLAFFLLFVGRSRPGYASALAVLVAGDALLLLLLARTGVVRYMSGMAHGGYNLPLLPSFYILVLLGILIAAACILINTLRLRQAGGAIEYLILVSAFALPAAFGRCDAGHVFMNTLGAYIAAWTVLSYRAASGRWMVWSYVLCTLFLPLALYQENNFCMFPVKAALLMPSNPHPAVRAFAEHALLRIRGPEGEKATLAKWRAKFPIAQPSNVPTQQPVLAPFGYVSTVLTAPLHPSLTNGRYEGLGNVMTAGEVQDKLDELHAYSGKFLFFSAGSACPAHALAAAPTAAELAAADHETRKNLFLNLLPFFVPRVRHHADFFTPLCTYIRAHYEPTAYAPPLQGGEIWQRRP